MSECVCVCVCLCVWGGRAVRLHVMSACTGHMLEFSAAAYGVDFGSAGHRSWQTAEAFGSPWILLHIQKASLHAIGHSSGSSLSI